MSQPGNAEGYPGPAWLCYTLVRPLTSARDCTGQVTTGRSTAVAVTPVTVSPEVDRRVERYEPIDTAE